MQIQGLYNLFCWHSRPGLCSASKPAEGGRGADVQTLCAQMFVEFEFLNRRNRLSLLLRDFEDIVALFCTRALRPVVVTVLLSFVEVKRRC